ncbi:MAG: helix-turn-helix transcriptional regulator, partial [Bacteroidota bacterium]|nr:helix-turn-helix transcriptional regulator [Bacteroidota bacterium]
MSLNERIVLIMDRSEMNRSEFADKLGIGRPVLSHILSGRNKPSLSVVEKILEQFPDIDPMWLITGNP